MTTKRTPRKEARAGRAPKQPPALPEYADEIRLTGEEAEHLAKRLARDSSVFDEEADALGLLLLFTALTYTPDVLDRETILGAVRREVYPLLFVVDQAAGASVVAQYHTLRERAGEKGGDRGE